MGIHLDLDDVALGHRKAEQELKEMRELIETLKVGIKSVAVLILESRGVAGLHRNGDVAEWDWLIQNSWLDGWAKAEKLCQS